MQSRSTQAALRKIHASRPNAFIFSVSSTITAQDIELFYNCIEAQSQSHHKFDLMIIFNDYDGIDWGTLFNNDTASMRQRVFQKLRRYVLVGGPSWLPMAIDFFRPFGTIETNWCPLEDINKAWDFIGAKPVGEWYVPVLEEIKHILKPFDTSSS